MGKQIGYDYEADNDGQNFRFTSKGPNGEIVKIAVISPAYIDVWYFAFGDAIGEDGDFDDGVITNNGDMNIVLLTLANIISDFLVKHPNSEVVIIPVDERRRQLYHRILQRNFDEISSNLLVNGVMGKVKTLLKSPPLIMYEAYTVLKKSTNFGKKTIK